MWVGRLCVSHLGDGRRRQLGPCRRFACTRTGACAAARTGSRHTPIARRALDLLPGLAAAAASVGVPGSRGSAYNLLLPAWLLLARGLEPLQLFHPPTHPATVSAPLHPRVLRTLANVTLVSRKSPGSSIDLRRFCSGEGSSRSSSASPDHEFRVSFAAPPPRTPLPSTASRLSSTDRALRGSPPFSGSPFSATPLLRGPPLGSLPAAAPLNAAAAAPLGSPPLAAAPLSAAPCSSPPAAAAPLSSLPAAAPPLSSLPAAAPPPCPSLRLELSPPPPPPSLRSGLAPSLSLVSLVLVRFAFVFGARSAAVAMAAGAARSAPTRRRPATAPPAIDAAAHGGSFKTNGGPRRLSSLPRNTKAFIKTLQRASGLQNGPVAARMLARGS